MGIVVFLSERQFKIANTDNASIVLKIKCDLIYRLLIHNDNLKHFHDKLTIFKWEDEKNEITKINISEFTSEFLIDKTQFDIQEMNKLTKIRLEHPNKKTKFYREKMSYSNRQLKTIQGYIDELDGRGRNSYFI